MAKLGLFGALSYFVLKRVDALQRKNRIDESTGGGEACSDRIRSDQIRAGAPHSGAMKTHENINMKTYHHERFMNAMNAMNAECYDYILYEFMIMTNIYSNFRKPAGFGLCHQDMDKEDLGVLSMLAGSKNSLRPSYSSASSEQESDELDEFESRVGPILTV